MSIAAIVDVVHAFGSSGWVFLEVAEHLYSLCRYSSLPCIHSLLLLIIDRLAVDILSSCNIYLDSHMDEYNLELDMQSLL